MMRVLRNEHRDFSYSPRSSLGDTRGRRRRLIDELTIYNLSVKYPCTVDLVREIENIARADAIEEVLRAMYHEAFEVDHEKDGMQKWDSGNWIRYKLFEQVMEQLKEQNHE